MAKWRIEPLATLAGALVLGGLAGLPVLAAADDGSLDSRFWVLAWGALTLGLVLFAVPPILSRVEASREQNRARLQLEAEARAAYVAPTADDSVYNEGQWWLALRRGSNRVNGFRCDVFDPHGESVSKQFGQSSGDPIMLMYPEEFKGVSRPLPTGVHTVVWRTDGLTLEGKPEEARTTFSVDHDADECATLRADLRSRRDAGEKLLGELPDPPDFEEWHARAEKWADELEDYFRSSVHLGRPAASMLSLLQDLAARTSADAARLAIRHRLDAIDEAVARFGGTGGAS
jgi:hypothetical protein